MAQAPVWTDPPKLVVGIVVDQMRADFIQRFWDNYGDGGFKRLVLQGSHYSNAHHPYVTTDTGPGHASIYTGTTPSRHGVVANDRYDRALGRTVYCVEDPGTKLVGTSDVADGSSPMELQAGTITDELERATQRRSHTIGISLKDRGAVLPMGRTGDAAFWYHFGNDPRMVSSTWYMERLPKWLEQANTAHSAASYLNGKWELFHPVERYHGGMPDTGPFEYPLPSAPSTELPLDIDAMMANGAPMSLLQYIPAGNTLVTDMAIAALSGEELGKDEFPDLLAISYSAPDKLGHRMGPLAWETEDMYIRLDRELERLLKTLDEQVGDSEYIVFLTADHGVPDIPEYRKTLRSSAGYVDVNALQDRVEQVLVETIGPGPWVVSLDDEALYLDHELVKQSGKELAWIQALAATAAMEDPGMLDAIPAADLRGGQLQSGYRGLVQNGYSMQRGADLFFNFRPGFQPMAGKGVGAGTDHGTGWNYDTHVPVILFGKGFPAGEHQGHVYTTDIIPTLALRLGIAFPDASGTVPLPPVVGY